MRSLVSRLDISRQGRFLLALLLFLSFSGKILAADEPAAARLSVPQPVVPPPFPPSPVDQFREWLKMEPAQREKALEDWPEAKRVVLRAKLQAYDALPSEERERRLKMLDLRWYLRPLMSMVPAERTAALNLVPQRLLPLVRERLEKWDSLPRSVRDQILASEDSKEIVTRYFAQLRSGQPQSAILSSMNQEERRKLDEALRTWKETKAPEREHMAEQLASFFELPPREREKTLDGLSEKEQQEMQRTLDAFARLSPEQRRQCVESFQKFAMMSPSERSSFLRNAQRWQAMTPREREAWKELVMKLPPLPPEPIPNPPMPNLQAQPDSMAGTNPPRLPAR